MRKTIKIIMVISITSFAILFFVFVLGHDYFFLTPLERCTKMIQTQKEYLKTHTDSNSIKTAWEMFDYYWNLDHYDCSQYYDKIETITEIQNTLR